MTSSDRPAENLDPSIPGRAIVTLPNGQPAEVQAWYMDKDEASVLDQLQRMVAARSQQYPDQPDEPRPIVLVLDEASHLFDQAPRDPDSPAVMLNRLIREWQRARRTEKPLLWREHVTTQRASLSQCGPAEDTGPAEETGHQA